LRGRIECASHPLDVRQGLRPDILRTAGVHARRRGGGAVEGSGEKTGQGDRLQMRGDRCDDQILRRRMGA
jgi:hypothetical protein